MTTKEWLGPEELAKELGVPVRTIYAWRSKRYGPRAARFGKHVRFSRSDVDDWCREQRDQDGPNAA